MKKSILSTIIMMALAITTSSHAQVGIGVEAANIDASAQLEVASTTKGFLPPRMTNDQKVSISSPAAGLVVWCTNCGAKGELQVYNGTEWVNMIGGAVSAVPTPTPVAIGDTYQGGIVFYILQSGDTGYDAAKQHGLIAATIDQNTVDEYNYATTKWFDDIGSNNNLQTNATGDGIGAGKLNTQTIITSFGTANGTYAAQLCADYRGGDYTDWYLPSIYELSLLRLQRDVVGGMTYSPFGQGPYSYPYWSSTEFDASSAYFINFTYSDAYPADKVNSMHVRAIRSF